MSKVSKDKTQKPIKDEPGAEGRFKRILGRALNTPPPRHAAKRKSTLKKTTK